MGIIKFINDERFNVFFSVVLGIGLVALFRPICSGSECNVSKPPTENDFDKYAYRMGNGKCYEFKTELIECPSSGAVEAFKEYEMNGGMNGGMNHGMNEMYSMYHGGDMFSRRYSPAHSLS